MRAHRVKLTSFTRTFIHTAYSPYRCPRRPHLSRTAPYQPEHLAGTQHHGGRRKSTGGRNDKRNVAQLPVALVVLMVFYDTESAASSYARTSPRTAPYPPGHLTATERHGGRRHTAGGRKRHTKSAQPTFRQSLLMASKTPRPRSARGLRARRTPGYTGTRRKSCAAGMAGRWGAAAAGIRRNQRREQI